MTCLSGEHLSDKDTRPMASHSLAVPMGYQLGGATEAVVLSRQLLGPVVDRNCWTFRGKKRGGSKEPPFLGAGDRVKKDSTIKSVQDPHLKAGAGWTRELRGLAQDHLPISSRTRMIPKASTTP